MKSFFKILSIVIFTGLFQFGTCDFEDVEDTTPTQSMTDSRDGKQYKTVQIGSQVWMAENLNYYHLESWYYNNDSISNYDYGRLYKWGTAKLVCPSGWHLPSDDEWKDLEMALGMSQAEADQTGLRGSDQANQLKSTYGWDQNSGTNSSGFNAFPAGWRHSLGGDKFYMIGTLAYFWSSTPNNINSGAMVRKLDALDGRIDRTEIGDRFALSIRCVKN